MTYPPQTPYQSQTGGQPDSSAYMQNTQPQASPSGMRKKKVISIIVGILALAIVVLLATASVSAYHVWSRAVSRDDAYGTVLTDDRYDLQNPLIGIDPKKEFKMTVNRSTVEQVDGMDAAQWCTFLCVYADPGLEVPVPLKHRMHTMSNGLSGSRYGLSSDRKPSKQDLGITGVKNDGWGGYEQYWLVQWRDKAGVPLAKPKVTYFTVADKSVSDLGRPGNPQLTVTDNGVLRASWDAVEGAQQYRVHLMLFNPMHKILRESGVFTTKATSFAFDRSAEPDTCEMDGQQQCDADAKRRKTLDEGRMNALVADLVVQSEDDAQACRDTGGTESSFALACISWGGATGYTKEQRDQFQKEFDPTMDVSKGWVGVTAVDAQGRESYASTVSLQPIAGEVPIYAARYSNSLTERSFSRADVAKSQLAEDVQKHGAQYHVTMLNGRTKGIYKECRYGDDQLDLPQEYIEMFGVEVVCTVPGASAYTVKETFKDRRDFEDYQAKVSEWKKESDSRSTLLRPSLTQASGDVNVIDSRPIGKNGVERYKPFGSMEYSRYVAENLLAMHTAIDITEYAGVLSAPDYQNVVREAIRQNPYLQVMAGADWSGIAVSQVERDGRRILQVGYGDYAAQARDEFYAQVKKAADAVTAGATREGAIQIEDYLAQVAAYDDEAAAAAVYASGKGMADLAKEYPATWTGGALTTGKGVDTSYALSFDAIADQVGLTSMVVTGWAGDGPHMWNRVLLDGRWLDIDPSWDDAGERAADTYRLKDADTLDNHTTEADWLLPMNASAYGIDATGLGGASGKADHVEAADLYDGGAADNKPMWHSWRLMSMPSTLAVQLIWIDYLAFIIYFLIAFAKGGEQRRGGSYTPKQVFSTRMWYTLGFGVAFSLAVFWYGDLGDRRGWFAMAVVLLLPLLLVWFPGFIRANQQSIAAAASRITRR